MTIYNDDVEKVAQDEIYPQRYFGRQFPGEWPSERHQTICRKVAQQLIEERLAATEETPVPEIEVAKPVKRPKS